MNEEVKVIPECCVAVGQRLLLKIEEFFLTDDDVHCKTLWPNGHALVTVTEVLFRHQIDLQGKPKCTYHVHTSDDWGGVAIEGKNDLVLMHAVTKVRAVFDDSPLNFDLVKRFQIIDGVVGHKKNNFYPSELGKITITSINKVMEDRTILLMKAESQDHQWQGSHFIGTHAIQFISEDRSMMFYYDYITDTPVVTSDIQ